MNASSFGSMWRRERPKLSVSYKLRRPRLAASTSTAPPPPPAAAVAAVAAGALAAMIRRPSAAATNASHAEGASKMDIAAVATSILDLADDHSTIFATTSGLVSMKLGSTKRDRRATRGCELGMTRHTQRANEATSWDG